MRKRRLSAILYLMMGSSRHWRPFSLQVVMLFLLCISVIVVTMNWQCSSWHRKIHTGEEIAKNVMQQVDHRPTSLKQDNEQLEQIKQETGRETKVTSKRRYLAPIHVYFDNGPNWAFKAFRDELYIALLQNRTIVEIPFQVHDRFELKIVHTRKTLEETFDVDKIRELLPVATIDEFYEDCKDELQPEIKWTPFRLIQNETISNDDRFYAMQETINTIGRQLPVPDYEADSTVVSDETVNATFVDEIWKTRCLAVYYHRDIRWLFTDYTLFAEVDKHLAWAPQIRGMVDGVFDKICGGAPFPHVHWRNATGENCLDASIWSNWSCPPEDRASLKMVTDVVDLLVDSLVDYMKSKKYECMYIAAAPFPQAFLNRMRAKFPHIVTLQTIFEMSAEISEHKDDLYTMSIIEQEIAVRAELFLGSRWSNWSRSVYYIRDGLGRTSLPLVKVPNMPAVLNNTW